MNIAPLSRACALLFLATCFPASARAKDDTEQIRLDLVAAYEKQDVIHRAWSVSRAEGLPGTVTHIELLRAKDFVGVSLTSPSGVGVAITNGETVVVMDGWDVVSTDPGSRWMTRRSAAWVRAREILEAVCSFQMDEPRAWQTAVLLELPGLEPDTKIGIEVSERSEPKASWLHAANFSGTARIDGDLVHVE